MGITYLSLIMGELVPKRIALAQPERIASLVAGAMRGLSLAAAPAVWVLHVSTEKVLGVLGLSGVRETTVTEEEVKSLIAEGTQAGIFVPLEQKMIEGVLRLADRPVRVIMTQRSRIAWIDVQSDLNTIVETVGSNRFSRLLVCNGTVDRPIGIVQIKDLLPEALRRADFTLAALMTPLLCVPDHTPVLRLINRFKKEKLHIALVIDEHGTTEGIVTLTDVIEAIAGDLPEQGEENEPKIVQRNDRSWLVDGALPTDEVETITGIRMGKGVKTVAGFVLDHMGRIPEAGEGFSYGNARFEVVDMDGNRIDKVLVEMDRRSPESL
jgi:putative hemolysin